MSIEILNRLRQDTRGNLAVVFAVAAVPLTFSVGMGVDYAAASYRQDQLNAIADAAALSALRPSVLAQPESASIAAAKSTFNAQATSIKGLTYDPASLKVTAGDTVAGAGVRRTVNVAYTATSQNSFMTVMGKKEVTLTGSAQATASAAPNIDFYLLLDDSPSMAIAATQKDIDTMVKATPSQGGCAFACHQTNPAADNLGNPGGIDNYALAKQLGVTMRIDMLRLATQNLMTTAQQVSASDGGKYRMAIYTFDALNHTIQTLTSDLSAAQTAAAKIDVLTVYKNNWLTSTNNNSDTDTNYVNAFYGVNGVMPTPGNGSNSASDTPQQVLFLVTDGVQDASINGKRVQSVIDTKLCDMVKARGIRIAVLYTTYYPLPTNAWYNTYIGPFQNKIGPTLQSCASPELYFEVSTGGDISAAMSALFQKAVVSAYLSK